MRALFAFQLAINEYEARTQICARAAPRVSAEIRRKVLIHPNVPVDDANEFVNLSEPKLMTNRL